MDKITIDFLKQEIPALKQISTNYANELVDYFNKYCFSKNEVFFIYDALYKNNKKFHNIKKFLHYLKLQKINFKYFNCRLKRIIKLKKNSMSLIVFLLKYGKNKAYEFYENRKKNVGKTKQQYIEKFGIEEATKILKTKASSASLNNCIKKFGIDEVELIEEIGEGEVINKSDIMQTLLLTLVFIGIYTVVKIIIVEYAHDKNMHE
jgi:hypothetical protein